MSFVPVLRDLRPGMLLAIAVCASHAAGDDFTLVKRGSAGWRYTGHDARDLPPMQNQVRWYESTYKADSWKPGRCPLGYTGKKHIELPANTTKLEATGNYYFRKTFDMPAGAPAPKDCHVRLKVASDNKAWVYLNGQLVDQDPHTHDFAYWNRFERLPPERLSAKGNVLAVVLHNGVRDIDAYLDVELTLERKADALPSVRAVFGKPLFWFVTVSDPHGGRPLRRAVQQIHRLGPPFVLATGDITGNGKKNAFRTTRDILAQLGVPLHTIPGNHDVDTHPVQVYEDYFGKAHYSFKHEGCAFICLNTAVHK